MAPMENMTPNEVGPSFNLDTYKSAKAFIGKEKNTPTLDALIEQAEKIQKDARKGLKELKWEVWKPKPKLAEKQPVKQISQPEPLPAVKVEKAPDFTTEQQKANIAIVEAMKWMSMNGSFYSKWDMKNPDYALVKQPDGGFYLWDKPVGDTRMIFKLNAQLQVIEFISLYYKDNTIISGFGTNMMKVSYVVPVPFQRP